MGTGDVVGIALGLAMDAAAVSLGAAASGFAGNGRAVFRLSFHFGLFQCLFPILGWYLGIGILSLVQQLSHWVAFGLLMVVGGRMVMSGFGPEETHHRRDPSRGLTMVLLSVAVSIDALAVGLSLAMLGVGIWSPAVVIGGVTSAMSMAAIYIGRRLGTLLGKRMEVVGGLVLVVIGIRILLTQPAA